MRVNQAIAMFHQVTAARPPAEVEARTIHVCVRLIAQGLFFKSI